MTRLRAHGLTLDVVRGWEARFWMPPPVPDADRFPVVRLANFPLRRSTCTYAEDLIEELRPGHVLASLVEFSPRLADRGLYAERGVPRLRMDDLNRRALQWHLPGRLGVQRFFSARGRAFCLYAIVREGPGLRSAIADLNAQLRAMVVEPR
jgi:hypothetical protein